MTKLLRTLFVTAFAICTTHTYAQDDSVQTIADQFDKIYKISSTYQNYKVISKDKYADLKTSVLDSIDRYTKLLSEKEKTINSKANQIESLQNKLAATESKLETAKSKENSFSFLGIAIAKGTYNLIVWVLVAILLAALIHFIYQYSKSHVVTKNALQSLEEIEEEFESHRKKTMEREQKLRRQLHDEINKNRNS